MERNDREVRFDIYCETCAHKGVVETDSPCNECLEAFWRDGSERPEKYVAKKPASIIGK